MKIRVEYEATPIRHIAAQCPKCERRFDARDGGLTMLCYMPARGGGKTRLAQQQLRKALDRGETVLYCSKSGLFLIDKNGARPIKPVRKPKKDLELQRRIACLDFEFKDEAVERARERMWAELEALNK